MSDSILFSTIHGSRLYNLHHAGSDYDYYTVVKDGGTKARQSIKELDDTFTIGMSEWLGMCQKGVPQALEAMFSQKAEFDKIPHFRSKYFVGAQVTDTYLRTIKSFCYSGIYKRKRHGLRLALNLRDLHRHGRFDPTLSPNEVDIVSTWGDRDSDAVFGTAMNIALDSMPDTMVR